MTDGQLPPALRDRLVDHAISILRIIPASLAWRLGGWCGEMFSHFPAREPRRCREHLAKAYPHQDRHWVEATTRATFRHAGRMALWTLATLRQPARRMRRGIALEGAQNLRDLYAASHRGEGTVGWSGHFGNWELLARIGGGMMPLSVVGRRLRSALANRLVQGARTSEGAEVLYQDQDVRDFVRALRAGRVVATLADQDVPRLAGVFVPWFNAPAYTPSGPAALSLLTGAPIQHMFLFARAGRWVLHVGPRVRWVRSGNTAADIQALTTWATQYMETLVRRAPQQWVWWHQRWRTSPEDVAKGRQRDQRPAPPPVLPST